MEPSKQQVQRTLKPWFGMLEDSIVNINREIKDLEKFRPMDPTTRARLLWCWTNDEIERNCSTQQTIWFINKPDGTRGIMVSDFFFRLKKADFSGTTQNVFTEQIKFFYEADKTNLIANERMRLDLCYNIDGVSHDITRIFVVYKKFMHRNLKENLEKQWEFDIMDSDILDLPIPSPSTPRGPVVGINVEGLNQQAD